MQFVLTQHGHMGNHILMGVIASKTLVGDKPNLKVVFSGLFMDLMLCKRCWCFVAVANILNLQMLLFF